MVDYIYEQKVTGLILRRTESSFLITSLQI
jgi:hypothetical protein